MGYQEGECIPTQKGMLLSIQKDATQNNFPINCVCQVTIKPHVNIPAPSQKTVCMRDADNFRKSNPGNLKINILIINWELKNGCKPEP